MSLENSLELNVVKQQMMNSCSFSLGKKRLEELQPVYDPLIVRRENERIREMLAAVVSYGPLPFMGISDIRQTLANAKKGRILSAAELNSEARLIDGIKAMHGWWKALPSQDHAELDDLFSSFSVHERTARRIRSCIDEYGEVLDSASPVLRTIRREKLAAEAAVNSAVQRFMAGHSDSVVDSIVTYRAGRAVVLVKASEKNSLGGLFYGDSASGQASYIEPPMVAAANNHVQEVSAREREEIQKILKDLSNEVAQIAEEEAGNIVTCGILDELNAKAVWGREHDATAARLSASKVIDLKKARHPLIDPRKVVSNDYHLSDPKHVLLITGPNTGGKTVSMKIIGLFSLMTYCGMPVSAESAVLPVFSGIYEDIGDDSSVVSSLSSFSGHIEKQAYALNHADGNSLVLLDEVGSGTDPKEGEALAIAILNELRERQCMVIATTHYSRLKAYGKRHEDILLASMQFDMEKLEPTYRYVEGATGQSNALEVAERYGLPKSVIRYARFLKDQARTQEDQLIERLEQQLDASMKKQQEMDERLSSIKEYQKQLESEKLNLEREKDAWKARADAEAEAYVEETRKKADEVLKQMRRMQQNARYHEVLAERQKLNRGIEEEQPEAEEVKDDKGFAKGDVVELRSTDQVAKVIEVRRKDIVIDLHGRQLHVSPNKIRHSLKVIPKEKPETVVTFSGTGVFDAYPSEVNLIGRHVDEAMDAMDSYMDGAKIHGLKSFRIIHGDGSGALRKAVHASLARNKDVKEFRLGMPQEGGTGATVVTLK